MSVTLAGFMGLTWSEGFVQLSQLTVASCTNSLNWIHSSFSSQLQLFFALAGSAFFYQS